MTQRCVVCGKETAEGRHVTQRRHWPEGFWCTNCDATYAYFKGGFHDPRRQNVNIPTARGVVWDNFIKLRKKTSKV